VIYGVGKAPVSVCVPLRELERFCYSSSFFNSVFDVDIGNGVEKVIPRVVVFHPVSDGPIHIDFQRVDKNAKIKISVPIEFINEDKSPGIKKGAVLNVVVHQLECQCLLTNMPSRFTVDLSGKDIGDTFCIADLHLSSGVDTLPSDTIVATFVGASSGEGKEAAAELSAPSS
jgi:large subunit ribosomal protein L25